MKEKDDFQVTKIPLEMFINLLVNIYESGANFIDLAAIIDEEEDNETKPANVIKLSDDNINDLI